MTFIQLDRASWPALLRFAGGYWLIYLVLNCVLWGLAGVDPIESMPGKLVLVGSCLIMALGISLMLKRHDDASVPYQAALSLCLSIGAALVFVIVDHLNLLIYSYPEAVKLDPVYIGFSMIEGLAIFFGWSCLSMMFLSGAQEKAIDTQVIATPPSDLTGRQREILALLLHGKSNKEIARELSISPLTVRNHISVLFRQFGVKRRKDLAEMVEVLQSPLSA